MALASNKKHSRLEKVTKSRTFGMEKYSEAPTRVKFPTSPQLIAAEGVVHFGHPQHPLCAVDVADVYTCGGCKESGAGKRLVCQRCNYELHPFCASAPPSLRAHPLHCHHLLLLFSKPVKHGQLKCDVCGKASKGYAFRCSACPFQMHPCCAMLTPEIKIPGLHAHPLRLFPPHHDAASSCGECHRKRPGRVYCCGTCEYQLHAVCAKLALNGLRENGHHEEREKPATKMFGSAARLASQVMIEFIGGLIEGFAEGVGQVIAQDALKAKSPSSSSSSSRKSPAKGK